MFTFNIGAVHTEPMKDMNLKSYPTDLTDAQWENLENLHH